MAESYEHYYASTVYDDRYPSANGLTLSRVRAAVGAESLLVDVGAGNGRYALPLARLGHRVAAIERSSIARNQLAERVGRAGLASRVDIYGDLSEVPAGDLEAATHVLLLFGVLGHMNFRERKALLGLITSSMPSVTSVIGSVPNRRRRFREEQRQEPILDAGCAPRFSYTRSLDSVRSTFEYTAFTPVELCADLGTHGWRVDLLAAESSMAEETVTRGRVAGRLDRIISGVLPPIFGYGLYFEAVPVG